MEGQRSEGRLHSIGSVTRMCRINHQTHNVNLLCISGSPVHLSKAILSVLSNSAEGTPNGGRIYLLTQSRYIDRPIRGYHDIDDGEYVELVVSDPGPSISSEDTKRMFEPFYTKKVMGRSDTGLGMAVVKDHRGGVDIQSMQAKGTTLTLYFPATRVELTKARSASAKNYMGKGESILVVDDVEEPREIASMMLNRLGYPVKAVSTGEDAIDYARNNPADLLVVDMIMDPGIDGLEMYRRILELHPYQRAIFVSGFSETERVRESKRLSGGPYVSKPYSLERVGTASRGELDK